MYTNQVTVTIGRNVGPLPLDDAEWLGFQEDVRDALHVWLNVPYRDIETHAGRGEWDGVAEESMKFSALVPDYDGTGYPQLRAQLAIIRDAFRQDAIALNVGVSELV